eukprot:Selendium_serpulae@DN4310_c0_g1_i4.p1
MSEDMYDEGFTNQVNIDISSVVISALSQKHRDKANMQFLQMSVTNMAEFGDQSFDTIVDKGTADSLLCGEDFSTNIQLALKEVSRVLKCGGRYIVISYGKPTYRLTFLKRDEYQWEVQIKTVKKLAASIM